MGGAIACGLVASGRVEASAVTVADPAFEKLRQAGTFSAGVSFTDDNSAAAADADVVVVAVKPWLAGDVVRSVAAGLKPGASVVSIAAGITLEQIDSYLADSADRHAVFRVIPNTAITFARSVTFVCGRATAEETARVVSLFEPLGKVFEIPEADFTAATALSSCGIAYALRYIGASIDGGVEMGLSPEVAREAVLQTVRGALTLLDRRGEEPQAEIDRVTTPGGITLRGLEAMEEAGFSQAVRKGLKASR